MAKLSKANAALLASVVAAMAVTETPYAMLTEKEIAPLVKEGLVETNPEIRDGDKIAVRATDKGIQMNTENTAPAGASVVAAASSFEIDDNVPLPTSRGGRGANVYPFDSLQVGQSFHVPATADKPNPAKTLASTVSSATARYAEPTGEKKTDTVNVYQVDADGKRVKGADGKLVKIGTKTVERDVMRETRKFVVRSVDEKDPRGKGARVFRTA